MTLSDYRNLSVVDNIKETYLMIFHDQQAAEEIKPDITFAHLIAAMLDGQDPYKYMGIKNFLYVVGNVFRILSVMGIEVERIITFKLSAKRGNGK